MKFKLAGNYNGQGGTVAIECWHRDLSTTNACLQIIYRAHEIAETGPCAVRSAAGAARADQRPTTVSI